MTSILNLHFAFVVVFQKMIGSFGYAMCPIQEVQGLKKTIALLFFSHYFDFLR